MAVHAPVRVSDPWWVITLSVKLRGKFEYFLGAEFNTVATSLATVLQNVDDAAGNFNVFYIKWDSPESHAAVRET